MLLDVTKGENMGRNIIDDLKDMKRDNITIEDVNVLSYRFKEYEIKDDYIYGKGKYGPPKYESLFNKSNKVDLILSIVEIGKTIYLDDSIEKTYYEDYKYENKYLKKPRIEVNIKTLNSNVNNKIYEFFEHYGIFNSKKYDLKVFLRRVLEFYCTIKIYEKIDKNEIGTIEEDMLLVLYPEFRKKNKRKLYEGIATNIQENGFLKNEKQSCVYENFWYNSTIQEFEMFKVSNDYIILAYYQLACIIILKKNGEFLPKCQICGEYIYDAIRNNKSICEKESCRKADQRRRTAKSREKKKRKENKI